MLSSIAAVLFVFALLGGLLRWARRWGGNPRPGRVVRVVDAVALGNGRSVTVVRSGERYFLLGATNHSISLIAELDVADVAASQESAGQAGNASGLAGVVERLRFSGNAR